MAPHARKSLSARHQSLRQAPECPLFVHSEMKVGYSVCVLGCIDRGNTGSGDQLIPLFEWVKECCLTTSFSCVNQVLQFSLLTLPLC